MVRRALLLSLALLLTVFAPVAAAQTGEYDGTSASGSVTADGILITGEGFTSNATVTYQVEYVGFDGEEASESGSATADAEGNVSFVIENRGDGSYVVVLTDGVNSATTTVVVGQAEADETAAPAPVGSTGGGGALPRTGDEPIGLAQVGIAAMALGAVAVYAGKRRRANAWAA